MFQNFRSIKNAYLSNKGNKIKSGKLKIKVCIFMMIIECLYEQINF